MHPTLVGVCRLSLVRLLLSISIFFLVGWIGGGRAKIRQGHQHYISANYDRAKQDFEAAWDQEPSLSNFNLGATYYQQQQFDSAEAYFQKALMDRADLVKSDVHYNIGNVQFQAGKIDQAIESYKSCLRLNPDDLDAKHNLEVALNQKRKQETDQGQSNDLSDENSRLKDNKNADDSQPEKNDRDVQQQRSKQADSPSNPFYSPQQQDADQSRLSKRSDLVNPEISMSKEEAIRLLEVLQKDEQVVQKQFLRRQFANQHKSDKDW